MRIDIIQNKFNFINDKYEILIDEKLEYNAKSKFLTIQPKIGIFTLNGKQILSVEKKSENINQLNYSLKRNENSIVDINTNSLIEFTIRNSKGTIHFCEQKNNLIGIFQNDNQVGIIDKNRKVSFGEDKYHAEIEKEKIDHVLVIGFIIAYDSQYNNDRNSLVHLDFGNVLIEPAKKINPNWKPND